MNRTKQFHWYEDISYFPSQCYYYFLDPKTGENIPELRILRHQYDTRFEIHSLKHDDYAFPEVFRSLGRDCPAEIYLKGTQGWLSSGHKVAIIGARDATPLECELAYQLGRQYFSDIVVSGLALGIDTAAHKGCVEAGGVSVAVVATGLDRIHPKENANLELAILQNGGMVVSEYPEGTKANPTRLIARTRLQMAIADKVIVVACEKESGTMHAVDWAIKLGKPIFAIDNDRSGNRHLIDNGIATPIAPPMPPK